MKDKTKTRLKTILAILLFISVTIGITTINTDNEDIENDTVEEYGTTAMDVNGLYGESGHVDDGANPEMCYNSITLAFQKFKVDNVNDYCAATVDDASSIFYTNCVRFYNDLVKRCDKQ